MLNYPGVVTFLLVFTVISGCAKKIEDHEIGDLIEDVLGHDIPDNYQVVLSENSVWYDLSETRHFIISFNEEEFEILLSGIDQSKWTKSNEVLNFEPSRPQISLQLIPSVREVDYLFHLRSNE